MKQSFLACVIVVFITALVIVTVSRVARGIPSRPTTGWVIVVDYGHGKARYIGPFHRKRTAILRASTFTPAGFAFPSATVHPLERP